jgi:hypothetical protein
VLVLVSKAVTVSVDLLLSAAGVDAVAASHTECMTSLICERSQNMPDISVGSIPLGHMERRKPQHRAIVLDTAAVSFKTYMFDGHPATDAQQCQLGTVMALPAMTVTITGFG